MNDSRITAYVVDFVYNDINGELVVEDAKGVETALFKLKRRWMVAEHGIEVNTV